MKNLIERDVLTLGEFRQCCGTNSEQGCRERAVIREVSDIVYVGKSGPMQSRLRTFVSDSFGLAIQHLENKLC